MLRCLSLISAALIVSSVFAISVDARTRKGARNPALAVKDCTRINGRFGYYANPWCTPSQQRAWDRASAPRRRR